MSLQSEHPSKPADVRGEASKSGSHSFLKLGLALLATLLLASSWLIFPYFVEGRKVLQDAGAEVAEGRTEQHRTLAQILTRYADGPGEADVDVMFATPEYFARSSSPRVAAEYEVATYHVFIVNEEVHIGELPARLPDATLVVDGESYAPYYVEGPVETDHHRTTILSFPRLDKAGNPVITDRTTHIDLTISNGWDSDDTARNAAWDLPISYPEDDTAFSSPMIVLALSAGLLSATLTPCLLQLIVVYMATLTGLSAEQMARGGAVPAKVRREMLVIALAFVFGFTLFYTAAGAVIGYAGKQAQLVFSAYSGEVAMGSGILVILMGLWLGIRARAPMVCRIPTPGVMNRVDKGGFFRSALLAVGFSLGCMVCFSGAIMATLFIYVGALGSATIGAFILFVFSMGVAIPFLAAAFFLSRTMSVMHWVSRYTPQIGLFSMIVIVAFGLVLVFDQFHTLSDLIYPWLGLN